MKTKKISKRLQLSKVTILDMSEKDKNEVKGGVQKSCTPCETFCGPTCGGICG